MILYCSTSSSDLIILSCCVCTPPLNIQSRKKNSPWRSPRLAKLTYRPAAERHVKQVNLRAGLSTVSIVGKNYKIGTVHGVHRATTHYGEDGDFPFHVVRLRTKGWLEKVEHFKFRLMKLARPSSSDFAGKQHIQSRSYSG